MKTWFKRKPVENLEEWLKIATKDLCAQAQARIRVEIQAHYQEAVESRLANGESIYKAEALALDELGDPKQAGRRLRRSHLTEREVTRLRNMEAAARKRPSALLTVGNLMIALGFIASLLDKTPPPRFFPRTSILLLLTLSGGLGLSLNFLLVRTVPFRLAIRRLWILRLIFDSVTFSIVLLWLWHFSASFAIIVFLLLETMSLRSWLLHLAKSAE